MKQTPLRAFCKRDSSNTEQNNWSIVTSKLSSKGWKGGEVLPPLQEQYFSFFFVCYCKLKSTQCSHYQAVTGKIYRLKQHFLLPATVQRFTMINNFLKKYICKLWSDPILTRNEWIYGRVQLFKYKTTQQLLTSYGNVPLPAVLKFRESTEYGV